MQVRTIKLLDRYIGNIFCFIVGGIRRFLPKKSRVSIGKPFSNELTVSNIPVSKLPIGKILIIQLWGIGESILALPSIKALNESFPNAKITVLATERNKDVFTGQKFIDRIKVLSVSPLAVFSFIIKNFRKYDIAIDMEEYLNISAIIAGAVARFRLGYSHMLRSLLYDQKVIYNDRQHCSETFADLARSLGAKVAVGEKLIPLYNTQHDRYTVDELLKKNGLKKKYFVAIAPGVAETSKNRLWPKERFAELADMLYAQGSQIAFVGGKSDIPLIEEIRSLMKNNSSSLAGKTSLPQAAYLISRAKLLIGNDSGPMHISAAMGTKTIGLFGPNLPVRFRPLGKDNIAVYKATCHCSPVINIHRGEFKDCEEDGACMSSITIEDVEKEATKLTGL
ncbi:glycosyltransferase family 9 protein [Candidatus Woesearchaeota archaeon]|nr:glycosyltransferase family 9 protein [Candidatus Woesearchaeota archaeon]